MVPGLKANPFGVRVRFRSDHEWLRTVLGSRLARLHGEDRQGRTHSRQLRGMLLKASAAIASVSNLSPTSSRRSHLQNDTGRHGPDRLDAYLPANSRSKKNDVPASI